MPIIENFIKVLTVIVLVINMLIAMVASIILGNSMVMREDILVVYLIFHVALMVGST